MSEKRKSKITNEADSHASGVEVAENISASMGDGFRSALDALAPAPDAATASPQTSRIAIPAQGADSEVPTLSREINLFGPSNLHRAIFCRQLATLIEVGIPLLGALKILAKRTAERKMSSSILAVAMAVEEGRRFSDAMDEHQRVFSPLVCNIVRVGEAGGILETSLARLAQIMESRADIGRKVRAALFYPLITLVIAGGVIALILMKAVPVFAGVYKHVDAELPAPTRFIISASDALTGGFWFWFPALIGLIVAGAWYRVTPGGRRLISVASFNIPGVSVLAKKIAVTRFSRTLGGLLSAGIPLLESLKIAARTHENVLVGDALEKIRESVEHGENFSRPLAKTRIFPPLVVDMIGIGEETGMLDRMLQKIADIYEADVDAALRGLTSIIEPVMITLLGGIVILIALAVMLPYFNLVSLV